jgi:EAL domain-containing protein (putative c-di-GMP-specific phosphodiesterase class I)
MCAAVFATAGAAPEWLDLEITETVVMTDPARACEVLAELRDVGVTIALDDYGTGQASLAWLKRLPLDVLKIDRSFVRDVAQGYVLSRPLPADAVPAFLAARAPAPARPRPARSPAIPLRHAAGPHGHRAHGAG